MPKLKPGALSQRITQLQRNLESISAQDYLLARLPTIANNDELQATAVRMFDLLHVAYGQSGDSELNS